MKNTKKTYELSDIIDNINSEFNSEFGGYNLVCEIFYTASRYDRNKIINSTSGTINQLKGKRSIKHILCLDTSYLSIGFYSKDGDRFYTLFNVSPTISKDVYHFAYNRNVHLGHHLLNREFKEVKSKMCRHLYTTFKEMSAKREMVVCSGIYPNLQPKIVETFEIEKDDKKFESFKLESINPPFNVLNKIHRFSYIPYNEGFQYEVGIEGIVSSITQRYPQIEKTLSKKTIKYIPK